MWQDTPPVPANIIPTGTQVIFKRAWEGEHIVAGTINGFDMAARRYRVSHSGDKWSYVRHTNIVAVW